MKDFYVLVLYVTALIVILGFVAPVLVSATSNALVLLGMVLILGTVPWLLIGLFKKVIKVLKRIDEYKPE
jgi:uncharacterized membrane protein